MLQTGNKTWLYVSQITYPLSHYHSLHLWRNFLHISFYIYIIGCRECSIHEKNYCILAYVCDIYIYIYIYIYVCVCVCVCVCSTYTLVSLQSNKNFPCYMDLVLNNIQRLIYHKTQPTNHSLVIAAQGILEILIHLWFFFFNK